MFMIGQVIRLLIDEQDGDGILNEFIDKLLKLSKDCAREVEIDKKLLS